MADEIHPRACLYRRDGDIDLPGLPVSKRRDQRLLHLVITSGGGGACAGRDIFSVDIKLKNLLKYST